MTFLIPLLFFLCIVSSHSSDFNFQCLVRDVSGAEGPITDLSGQIFMVSPSKGQILRLDGNHPPVEIANTGGIPAGLQFHADGSIWVADMKKGILKVTPEGEVIPVVTEFEGKPIRGCNDLIFDSKGNLYFTAPAGSNSKPGGAVGEVFFRSAEGEVIRLGDGFVFPNGIAVSPDERMVIFAETHTHKLWAADLSAPGKIQEWRVWAVLPHANNEVAGGDGMDFDAEGHLVATNYSRGTLEVYGPTGEHLRTIPLPFKKCSNVHFFPRSDHRLIVTEHENNALWTLDYGIGGHPQFSWR